MVLKAFDFARHSGGTHETYHEGGGADDVPDSPQFLVFCDALSLTGEEEAQSARLLTEQALTEYLTRIHEGKVIDEECVEKALQHAHRRLIQLFDDVEERVAVSVLLLAPKTEPEKEPSLIIGGAGDCRLYTIGSYGLSQSFADPLVEQPEEQLSTEERYRTLKNALCATDPLKVEVKSLSQGQFQRYLFASYGCYHAFSQDTLLELGLNSHHDIRGVAQRFAKISECPHFLRLSSASYEEALVISSQAGELAQKEAKEAAYTSAPIQKRRRERAAALALSVFVCGLVVFLAVDNAVDQEEPLAQATPPVTPHEEQRLIAKADPFDEEDADANSWVAALKEQNEIQRNKIASISETLKAERQQNIELQQLLNTRASEGSQSLVEDLGARLREKNKAITDLRINQEDLKREVHNSKNEALHFKNACENLKVEINKQKQTGLALEDQLYKLKESKDTLEQQGLELDRQLSLSQAALEDAQASLQSRNRDTLKMETALNEERERASELRQQLTTTEVHLANLSEEKDRFYQQLLNSNERLATLQELADSVDQRLKDQEIAFKGREEILRGEMESLRQEQQELVQNHAQTLNLAQERLASSTDTIERMSEELSSKTQHIQQLEQELIEAGQSLASSRQQIEASKRLLEAECERSSLLEVESGSYTQNMEQLAQQKEALEDSLRNAESLVASLTDEKLSLSEELQATASLLSQKERAFLETQGRLESSVQEVQEKLSHALEKEQTLQGTVASLHEEFQDSESLWRRKLQEAQQELSDQMARGEAEVSELAYNLQQKIQELNSQLEEQTKERAELAYKLEKVENTKNTLDAQLQEFHHLYTQEQEKAQNLQDQLQIVTSELEERDSELENSESYNTAYTKRYQDMEGSLTAQLSDIRAAYEKALTEHSKKEAALQEQLASLSESYTGYKAERDELAAQLDYLKKEQEATVLVLSQAEAQLVQVNEERSKEESLLAQELAAYKEGLKKSEQMVATLENDVEHIQETLEQKTEQLTRFSEIHSESQEQLAAQSAQLQQYKALLGDREQDLDELASLSDAEKESLYLLIEQKEARIQELVQEHERVLTQRIDQFAEARHHDQERIEALDAELRKVRTVLAQKEKEVLHLEDQVVSTEEDGERLGETLELLNEVQEVLARERLTHEEVCRQLERQVQEGNRDRLQLEKELLAERQDDRTQQALDRALSQLEETQAELAKEKNRHKESIHELRQLVQEYESKQEVFEYQLAASHTAELLDHEQKVQELQQRLDEQRAQVNKMEQLQLASEQQYQETYESLQGTLGLLNQTQETLTKERLTHGEIQSQMETRLSEELERRRGIERSLAQLEEQAELDEKIHVRYARAQQEIQALSNDKNIIERQSALMENELKEALSQLQDKELQLAELSRSGGRFKDELISLKEDYQERTQNLLTSKNEAEARVHILEEQLTNLEYSSSRVNSELAEAQHTVSRFDQLKTRNEALMRENAGLAEKMSAMMEFQEMYRRERDQRLELERTLKGLSQENRERREQPSPSSDRRRPSQSASVELEAAREEYARFRRNLAQVDESASRASSDPTRIHLVSEGETLTSISSRYYGSSRHWRMIYEANSDVVRDRDKITVGTALIIPRL